MERRLTDVRAAQDRHDEAIARRAHEGRFAALLYEQGETQLEPAVWAALRELGGKVDEPDRAGIEDGRFTDPQDRAGMLEIKGLSGQLGLRDVRQLHGWMTDAFGAEGWDGKGLVVANLLLDDPPWERSDLFAPNALTFAERTGICLMTAAQLYEALRQHQLGELDSAEFWDAVFATSGPIDLPEPPHPPTS